MIPGKLIVELTILLLSTSCIITLSQAFDDDPLGDHDTQHQHHDQHPRHDDRKPMPKDKILLRDVKTLVFEKNKKTTFRRTHPLLQLKRVGGTAGSRLMPDVVHCDNIGYSKKHEKYDWKCRAEISDRVEFKHVDVICEGYDYPEDDYILLGSCGLEFTLDYKSPHDYHEKSYYHHMDDHEKEIHRKKVIEKHGPPPEQSSGGSMLWKLIVSPKTVLQDFAASQFWLIIPFLILAIITFLIVKLFTSSDSRSSSGGALGRKKPLKASTYGPLTSAVLSTKKAC